MILTMTTRENTMDLEKRKKILEEVYLSNKATDVFRVARVIKKYPIKIYFAEENPVYLDKDNPQYFIEWPHTITGERKPTVTMSKCASAMECYDTLHEKGYVIAPDGEEYWFACDYRYTWVVEHGRAVITIGNIIMKHWGLEDLFLGEGYIRHGDLSVRVEEVDDVWHVTYKCEPPMLPFPLPNLTEVIIQC